jgi:hypothetical protein
MQRIATLLVAALAACGSTYKVDKTAVRTPQLRVTKVQVSKSATRVTCEYAAGERTRRVGINGPGKKGAFVITDANNGKKYAVRSASGIATLPERTTVEPRTTLKFVLEFEPLAEGTAKIHVGEGEYAPDPGEITWQVRDIELKR